VLAGCLIVLVLLLGSGPAFSPSSSTATVSLSYSAPSLLVNVVSSVGVGSWEVEVDIPLGVSVASASESGFMTDAISLPNPPQYRWTNLYANGQTTGSLTIPVTYAGIYTITLAIMDLKDVSGVSITVNPPLPINLVLPQISLLVTGPSSAMRGGSATFGVLATNPGSSVPTTVLYLEVIGSGGYYYFDTMQISAPAGSTARFQFTWQIPSSVQAGSYQVNVGLIPPTPTSISQTQIAVN
jgi:hypothetical protein